MRISDWSSDVCSSDLERACDDGFVGRGLGRGGFDCSVPHCLEQRHVHHVFPRLALDDACETVMGRRWRNNVACRQPAIHHIGNGSPLDDERELRSEEHTSELQSLMRISYAVFCLKKKTKTNRSN